MSSETIEANTNKGLSVEPISAVSVVTTDGLPPMTSTAPRVKTETTQAGVKHLADWDTSRKRRAVHEAAHAVASTVLGGRVKTIDISVDGRMAGYTETDAEDRYGFRSPAEIRRNAVVALAGLAIEGITGFTMGTSRDLSKATRALGDLIDTGADGLRLIPSSSALGGDRMTEALRAEYIDRLRTELDRAQAESRALVEQYMPQIIALAEAVYSAGRLSDAALDSAIRDAGLEPVVDVPDPDDDKRR
jgi:ATP-dependent Zn protease